ncbi:MAG: acyl-CoA dehydrogenase family protein, partial [Saprospiraceae bacterium]
MSQVSEIKSPEEVNHILNQIRRFVDDKLKPIDLDMLKMSWKEAFPILHQLRSEVKRLGLWCPQISVDYGGLGLTNYQHGLVSEILGQSPIGHYVFNCQAPDAGNMEILIDFGSDDQKSRFLAPLVAGDIRSCFSMTEPENAGSNPLLMS